MVDKPSLQIITVDDQDFHALLEHFRSSTKIAEFKEESGQIQMVAISKQFLMVAPRDTPDHIAISPSHSTQESLCLAQKYLDHYEKEGNSVKRLPE